VGDGTTTRDRLRDVFVPQLGWLPFVVEVSSVSGTGAFGVAASSDVLIASSEHLDERARQCLEVGNCFGTMEVALDDSANWRRGGDREHDAYRRPPELS